MNSTTNNAYDLGGVTADNIQQYLTKNGWVLAPFKRPELLVFEGPMTDEGEPILQILPRSEKASDFDLRAQELISALGVIENRPGEDVLRDIKKARLPDEQPQIVTPAISVARPGTLEDEARLPTTDFDFNEFAQNLSDSVLNRAYVMFQSLADDDEGILKSRTLAAKLNIENPQWLPGLLTTHLENAARRIKATLPWERLYDEQCHRYWICNPEVAQQIAESIKHEGATRHITIGINRNLAI